MCIAAGGDFVTQLVGVFAIGVFVFVVSLLVWLVLEKTIGVRVSESVEELGQDTAELGIEAYPEFVLSPTRTTWWRFSGTERALQHRQGAFHRGFGPTRTPLADFEETLTPPGDPSIIAIRRRGVRSPALTSGRSGCADDSSRRA